MRPPKISDFAAVIITLIFIGVFSYLAYSSPGVTETVRIKTDTEEWVYPMNEDDVMTFTGPVGRTVVEIRDGAVSVVSSDCKEQVCVRTGHIRRPGGWIVCLPNRIFIRIEGNDAEEIDAGTF